MKKLILCLSFFCLILSTNIFSQNKCHSYNWQPHTQSNQPNIGFGGGFIAGLVLQNIIEHSNNYRQMYFTYNFNKNTWRLKKDIYNNYSFFTNPKIVARFENPEGGRDFFVKINRAGFWWIDAPNRFKKILKNKVQKNI